MPPRTRGRKIRTAGTLCLTWMSLCPWSRLSRLPAANPAQIGPRPAPPWFCNGYQCACTTVLQSTECDQIVRLDVNDVLLLGGLRCVLSCLQRGQRLLERILAVHKKDVHKLRG